MSESAVIDIYLHVDPSLWVLRGQEVLLLSWPLRVPITELGTNRTLLACHVIEASVGLNWQMNGTNASSCLPDSKWNQKMRWQNIGKRRISRSYFLMLTYWRQKSRYASCSQIHPFCTQAMRAEGRVQRPLALNLGPVLSLLDWYGYPYAIEHLHRFSTATSWPRTLLRDTITKVDFLLTLGNIGYF